MTTIETFEKRLLDGMRHWTSHVQGEVNISISHVGQEVHIRMNTKHNDRKLEMTRVVPFGEIDACLEVLLMADFVCQEMIRDFCTPIPKGAIAQ